MTYNERRARRSLLNLEIEIKELEHKKAYLKELQQVAKDFLLSIHGPCEACQNGHWPHCGDSK